MLSFSRKRNKKNKVNLEYTNTIKCGLASNICPLFKESSKLMDLIRADALEYSKFHILNP